MNDSVQENFKFTESFATCIGVNQLVSRCTGMYKLTSCIMAWIPRYSGRNETQKCSSGRNERGPALVLADSFKVWSCHLAKMRCADLHFCGVLRVLYKSMSRILCRIPFVPSWIRRLVQVFGKETQLPKQFLTPENVRVVHTKRQKRRNIENRHFELTKLLLMLQEREEPGSAFLCRWTVGYNPKQTS